MSHEAVWTDKIFDFVFGGSVGGSVNCWFAKRCPVFFHGPAGMHVGARVFLSKHDCLKKAQLHLTAYHSARQKIQKTWTAEPSVDEWMQGKG